MLLLLLIVINRNVMWWAAIVLLAAIAGISAWGSTIDFATLKAYIDAHAPDGEVESYDAAYHERMRGHLGTVAWIFAAATVLVATTRRTLMETVDKQQGQWAAMRAELREGLSQWSKRTSKGHKRFVAFIILVGAVLRISQMGLPVIYDEAFTYTNYASQPLHFLFSNYTFPNNHIFHSFLVKLSTGLFGVHTWSLRLPALLAGIACMPLAYVFVRIMFNRYIALLTIAFIASSGALIEYSALARGYSLTWMFMLCAMLFGRHYAKTNNTASALLVAVSNTLGMWTVPTMIYSSVMIYIWLLLYLVVNYESSLSKRFYKWLLSLGVFLLLTALVYTPVIVVHSVDQLLHHPTMGENTWESFLRTHQDKALDLWYYFNDTAATWISIAGFMGLFYAAYISVKFRLIIVSMVLGAVPLVFIQTMIGPPRVWTYTLFIFHLSSGIAVFYLLKLVQDRVYKGFEKRFRTVVASVVVLVGMGWLGITGLKDRIERYPDARLAAEWFSGLLRPGDRIFTQFPWEAPFEFELMAHGEAREHVNKGPAHGAHEYVLVGPAPIDGQHEQTLVGVLRHNDRDTTEANSMVRVKDWKTLEIFAAP